MRDKIYLNLLDSTYIHKIYNISLYFSSKFYLEKYKKEVNRYVEQESARLRIRYNCNVNLQRMLVIAYYKKVEKRGFFAYDNSKEKEIKENEVFLLK